MTAKEQPFIFLLGKWLGHGKITFTQSPEELFFNTLWMLEEGEDGVIVGTQRVEVIDGGEPQENRLIFSEIKQDSFVVELSNSEIGTVVGKGVVDGTRIAWEFRADGKFEGFEVYQKLGDDEYSMTAEYLSGDQFRTIISGRIWKRGAGDEA